MVGALWFFSSRTGNNVAPQPITGIKPAPAPGVKTPVAGTAQTAKENAHTEKTVPVSQSAEPSQVPAAIPPERAVMTQPAGPTELPPDIQAQLNAPPPELPEDLKQQLNSPPPELPADLKAQLNAPPPELPEDIKRAMQTPPRMVTIDEVNDPDYLKKQSEKKAAEKATEKNEKK